jgi:hypothetical protein
MHLFDRQLRKNKSKGPNAPNCYVIVHLLSCQCISQDIRINYYHIRKMGVTPNKGKLLADVSVNLLHYINNFRLTHPDKIPLIFIQ